MNGAQILLACLKEQEADTLFGYPGGAVIPLYNELYDDPYFTHIRTAHEQGAVHAADGYARSSGKVGVCIVTSGPGASNAVTGIATAYMDSVPLVVITGQVATSLLGKDSFQEIDITGITLSITKHNYLVRNVDELADIVREAFDVANSGRPGPVLVDIPKDLFSLEGFYEKKSTKNINNKSYLKYEENIEKIVEMINNSQRPIIYAGGGIKIANASDNLISFAIKGDIPVVNTLMGLGSIPRNHDLSLGLVGMHGFRENNLAVTNSDLIIAIGARFSDRVIGYPDGFAPKSQIIHIDIDATEIDKNIQTEVFVLGNLSEILDTITRKIKIKDNKKWKSEIIKWKSPYKNDSNKFHPKNILSKFYEKLGPNSFVVTDVGQHQMWTAQYWDFMFPRAFVSSGGLGTMGFGLGGAIGTKIANMNKLVILVTGDGSFRMNCNELVTIASYNIPVIILLMNNQTLGMVRQWQKMLNKERYSQTDIDSSLDYVKLVNAYGIDGYSINSIGELEKVLKQCDLTKKSIFIECKIDKDECVYPMVPPGNSIDNLIEEYE